MTVESMRVSHGTARADTLTGGTGKDFLLGGTGADTLNAGAANDRINGGTGNDRINGGTGTDTLILSGARTAYTVTRLATTAVTYQIKGPDGTDRVTGVERVEFGGAAPVTIGTLVSSRRRAADRMADALTTHQPTLSAATTAPAGAKSNTGLLDALAAGPW
ncbi:MAG TPA: hypothetical protein VEB64_02060 [Azospirillaceae bacterium]|nr:hypothetical protein [Azospirillaceae bacterium]